MTFLPVVERELRVAARLPVAHRIRLITALVALAIGGWIMLVPGLHNTPAILGQALCVAMTIILNAYAIFAVLRTSDSLSEEKREGTLGLLFLTDLKGADIVLGKLAASSLHTFYGMLAVFPVMAISLLVGGVSGGEFWRIVLASINTLFFALAIGMFSSAISVDERKAAALAMFMMAFFVGLPLAGWIVQASLQTQWPNPIFFIPSPGYAVFMAFDSMASAFPTFNFFKLALVVQGSLSLLFLLLACLITPRIWHDKVNSAAAERRRSFWENLKYGNFVRRRLLRLNRLSTNPVFWLTSRDRVKNWFVWIFLAAIAALWFWGLWAYPIEWKDSTAYIWTGLILHLVLKLWIAGEAARRFSLDRQSGALELLLCTPLSLKQIVRGQMMSLFWQFAGPVAIVLCADLIFLANPPPTEQFEWQLMWVAGMAMLVADMVTLAWVGIWLGVNSRSVNRAATAAIARVLFLPWLVFLALLTMGAIYSTFVRRYTAEFNSMTALIILWTLLGFANNAIFGIWAARNVHARFRLAATQRFETASRWKRASSSSSP